MNAYLREAARLGIRSPMDVVRTVRNFAVTTWDPKRSDIAQGINLLMNGDVERLSEESLATFERRNPGVAALFPEGYDPEIDPRRLLALPEGTLGRAYAEMIVSEGLDPLGTLLVFGAPKNVVHYAIRRAYKLHDVLHIVLDADTSVLGEVRIVSFSLGQTVASRDEWARGSRRGSSGSISAALAYAVLVLHLTLRRPLDELGEAIRLSADWLELGARTEAYAAWRLEDMMAMPVDDVRRALLRGDACFVGVADA